MNFCNLTAGADDAGSSALSVQNVASIAIRADGARTKIGFNEVTNCGHSGISSSSVGSSFEGPLIVGNTVRRPHGRFIRDQRPGTTTELAIVKAGRLANHVEMGSTGIALQIYNCQFTKVTDNTATGSAQVFSVVGGSDNVVSGNTARRPAAVPALSSARTTRCAPATPLRAREPDVGITADNSTGTHIVISNNKVTGAQAQGIRVASYDHVSVVGNVVQQSPSAVATYGILEVSPTGPASL